MYDGTRLRSSAAEIAELVRRESGELFKADWHGATDEYVGSPTARVVTINRGHGFEPAVAVTNSADTFLYLGPFEIEQMPTRGRMLVFHCSGAMFVRERQAG